MKMDWGKAWLFAFAIWITLIVIGSIIMFGFHHCNGSCYFTNDIAEALVLPLGFFFMGWTIFLIPFGIVTQYLEEQKLKNSKVGDINE